MAQDNFNKTMIFLSSVLLIALFVLIIKSQADNNKIQKMETDLESLKNNVAEEQAKNMDSATIINNLNNQINSLITTSSPTPAPAVSPTSRPQATQNPALKPTPPVTAAPSPTPIATPKKTTRTS